VTPVSGVSVTPGVGVGGDVGYAVDGVYVGVG
jgi:hypothetical protein